jgi:hypothetical protein
MPARPSDYVSVESGNSWRLSFYFLIFLRSHQIVNNKFSEMTLDGREAVGEKQRKKDENG